MNRIENPETCILNFSSIGELLDLADKCPRKKFGSQKFTFGNDIETNTKNKTYKLLRAGKGLSTVRRLSKKFRHEFQNSDLGEIMNRVKSIKRIRMFNDFNGNLDFDRVMTGDPNYWEKVERNGKMKVVRVGINFAISCGNTVRDFSRLVALSAIFAEILENMGYGVEIYGSAMYANDAKKTKKRKNWLGLLFPVKAVTEPLDFDRIYSLGLPGLLRDANFRIDQVIYGEFSGLAMQPPQDMLKLADIDVLVSKSWLGGNQSEKIIQVIGDL